MSNLYVTGGRQRKTIFNAIAEEWRLYEAALILCIDVEKETCELCVEYTSPPEACVNSEIPSFLFKSGSLWGDRLYACTSTEVLIYSVPDFKLVGYISLPCFNDLHHVSLTNGGNLLVVNTGLDMVVEITPHGELVREWNVLGNDPWQSFSREVDYRKIATTKPHKSHPNHVLHIGDDIWVTRGIQRDCVSLTKRCHRIEIGSEFIHDGQVYNGKVYFTQVDGRVVIVDQEKRKVEEVVDLNRIDNDEGALLGWCRGVLLVDERRAWIGFTRVRKTEFRENIKWIKNVLGATEKPSHLALYDLVAKKRLKEIDVEKHGLNVLFSILPGSCASRSLKSERGQAAAHFPEPGLKSEGAKHPTGEESERLELI